MTATNLAQHPLAKSIRMLILDVDGILTDGTIYYDQAGESIKPFNIKDGLGLKLLQNCGIKIAIISGNNSAALKKRLEILGITDYYLNQHNKISAFEALLAKHKLPTKAVAYVGDDLPDLPLIERAGLGITVANSDPEIQKVADHLTAKPGGDGAVREICNALMMAQGHMDDVLAQYRTSGGFSGVK